MSDRGAAAVVLVATAGVVVALAAGLGVVGALWQARAQAAAAADAAALAAAPVTFRPYGAAGTPAAEAARFAASNGVRLVRCRCPVDRTWVPRTVTVTVERPVEVLGVGTLGIRASASAEFRPADLIQD